MCTHVSVCACFHFFLFGTIRSVYQMWESKKQGQKFVFTSALPMSSLHVLTYLLAFLELTVLKL